MKFEDFASIPVVKKTLFPVEEKPITHPKQWGKKSGYKFLVREDTSEVITCVTDEYQFIPNEEIVKQVFPAIDDMGGELVQARTFSNARTMYRFRFSGRMEIVQGDEVEAEMYVYNSYDGSRKFVGELGAYRLVCTNGLVIGKTLFNVAQVHRGSGVDLGGVADRLRYDVNFSEDVVKKLQPLTEIPFTEPEMEYFGQVFPQYGQSALQDRVEAVSGETYWDLYNAGSYVTSHVMEQANETTHKIAASLYRRIQNMRNNPAVWQ